MTLFWPIYAIVVFMTINVFLIAIFTLIFLFYLFKEIQNMFDCFPSYEQHKYYNFSVKRHEVQ